MDTALLHKRMLLLLYAGVALGFARSPFRQYKVLGGIPKEWRKIKEQEIAKEIQKLYRSKLVQFKEQKGGTISMVLTEKGKLKTLRYRFEEMRVVPHQWDGKWRMVTFDIPEKKKGARNALRRKLRELGFCELQKSVFVLPYECKDEIDFVIEFFSLRPYVRYGVLESIDNDIHLQKRFGLI